MEITEHLAELNPGLRFVVDDRPPITTKVYMVTQYGIGVIGDWKPEYQMVAWSPLPKFTPEQKERLEQFKQNGWRTPDGKNVFLMERDDDTREKGKGPGC